MAKNIKIYPTVMNLHSCLYFNRQNFLIGMLEFCLKFPKFNNFLFLNFSCRIPRPTDVQEEARSKIGQRRSSAKVRNDPENVNVKSSTNQD
jgi:hypothetical protein